MKPTSSTTRESNLSERKVLKRESFLTAGGNISQERKPTSSTTALAKQMANSIWNSQTDLQERIVDGRLSLTRGEMDQIIGYSLFSLKRKGKYVNGKVYDELEELTGMKRHTIQQYKQVAEATSCSRLQDLPYSHHREVASLPVEDQKELLMQAIVDPSLRNESLSFNPRRANSKTGSRLPDLTAAAADDAAAAYAYGATSSRRHDDSTSCTRVQDLTSASRRADLQNDIPGDTMFDPVPRFNIFEPARRFTKGITEKSFRRRKHFSQPSISAEFQGYRFSGKKNDLHTCPRLNDRKPDNVPAPPRFTTGVSEYL